MDKLFQPIYAGHKQSKLIWNLPLRLELRTLYDTELQQQWDDKKDNIQHKHDGTK